MSETTGIPKAESTESAVTGLIEYLESFAGVYEAPEAKTGTTVEPQVEEAIELEHQRQTLGNDRFWLTKQAERQMRRKDRTVAYYKRVSKAVHEGDKWEQVLGAKTGTDEILFKLQAIVRSIQRLETDVVRNTDKRLDVYQPFFLMRLASIVQGVKTALATVKAEGNIEAFETAQKNLSRTLGQANKILTGEGVAPEITNWLKMNGHIKVVA